MRRPVVLLEVLFTLALAAAAGVQHWVGRGIELGIFVLALLLAPVHLRRVLALLGRASAPSLALVGLETVALAGAFVYPVPPWSLAAAIAVVFALAWDTDPAPAKPPLRTLGVLALLALVAAGGSVYVDSARDRFAPIIRILTFAIVLLEAVSPWRSRSDRDSLRRLAAATALLGTCALGIRVWDHTSAPRVIVSAFVGVPAFLHLASTRPSVDDRARERRRIGMRIAAVGLVLGLVIVMGEVGFRIFPNHYRETATSGGFWHKPGATYVYEGAFLRAREEHPNIVVWNKEGWHDADHEKAKPPGTARLVLLGDSYVEGVQVPLEDLTHRRLERALSARSDRPVEAIALGQSGWGQVQELSCLREQGLDYAPDLVLDEFLPGNDVRNNDDVLEQLANDQSYRSTRAREPFIDALNSRLLFCAFVCDKVDLALRRFEGEQDSIDCDGYRSEPRVRPDRWKMAWQRTEDLLAEMKGVLASRGVALVVVIYTSDGEIEACVPGCPPAARGMDMRLPARRMIEICQRQGIACLDLAPRFAKHPPEVRHALHLVNDGHWSSSGHAEASAEIAKFLLDETDLWKKALARAAR